MFFNDEDDKQSVISPLNYDLKGRFSRKGKPKKIKTGDGKILESLLVFIFTFCLFATDFILFAGSGNIEVFQNSFIPTLEVMLGMAFFAVVLAIIITILHKHSALKYSFAAFIMFGFIYAVFTQFSQIQQSISLGYFNISAYIIIGCVFAGITYFIFAQKHIIFKYLLTISAVILFADIYIGYMHQDEPQEFIESYNSQKISNLESKRFVYFLFPNLVSYPYLSEINLPEAEELKQIMQGFYQKNNFKVFMHAYAPEQKYLDNMIVTFNPFSSKKTSAHLLDTKLLSGYWQFKNLKNEYVYLKNNQLYDIFRKNKFQISAYKSRDFDMCHAKHKINVNRCIEKINQPANIYSMPLSVFAKAKILLVEWLASLRVATNMSSIYNALATIIDADKIPMIGVDYNNLYVVNAIRTFDILFDDIKKDNGRQAYFVFADIPSNMYIYDEYCRLKPQEKWLDMANFPWIKKDYTEQRQAAYLQQTKCLYGKLSQFIDNMKKQNLWDDTMVVIQGISGVNNFKNYTYNEFIENFIANRLVTMAIHDKNIKTAEINMDFCSTNSILTKYLFHPNAGCKQDTLGIHKNLYQTLQDKLSNLTVGAYNNYESAFENWYNKWSEFNSATNNDGVETDIINVEDFGVGDLPISSTITDEIENKQDSDDINK